MGSKGRRRMESCVGAGIPTRTQAQEDSGRVSRTAAACSKSIGGGGAQGCTRRDVDCAATSAQKWLQKRVGGWLRRAVRGRVAGRAVRQADRARREVRLREGERTRTGGQQAARAGCGLVVDARAKIGAGGATVLASQGASQGSRWLRDPREWLDIDYRRLSSINNSNNSGGRLSLCCVASTRATWGSCWAACWRRAGTEADAVVQRVKSKVKRKAMLGAGGFSSCQRQCG
jgi:hypothetical protein